MRQLLLVILFWWVAVPYALGEGTEQERHTSWMLPCVVATKTKAHSAEPLNDSSALPQANIWPEMRKIVPKRDEMAHFGAIAHFLRTQNL